MTDISIKQQIQSQPSMKAYFVTDAVRRKVS